jgi:catechol 2,3-dioxygenase-like lactoylglutathione lyase family enzyme
MYHYDGHIDDHQSSDQEPMMSRVQLALNVNDLPSAIAFYTRLFGTEPAKVRDGYANFAVAEPPLKLVLIENPGQGGTLNHLGVEVATPEEVVAATARLQGEGLATTVQDQTTCCYAVQDKVWVNGPELPWEIYTVLADATTMAPAPNACCTPAAETVGIGSEPAAGCC